ncbi:MAG: DUF4271 domain-containing protein [Bacteroidales bacterium]|nr:DUF4271 domain-containing protein [Bacteroidales bacterium]
MIQTDSTHQATQQAIESTATTTQGTAVQHTVHAVAASSYIPECLLRPVDTIEESVPTFPFDLVEQNTLCYDSLFAPYKNLPIQRRESLFTLKSISSSEATPHIRTSHLTEGWIFGVIVLLLALVSIYLNNQKFRIRDVFISLFNRRTMDRVFRESNIRPRTFFPMTGIYIASLSMIAVALLDANRLVVTSLHSSLLFLSIVASLIVYLLIKNGIIRLFGSLFEDSNACLLYISSNYLFYFIGGLVSAPLLLLLFYCPSASEALLKTMSILVCIIFTIRLFRGMQLILTNSKTSKLYLFYYLCIFEIVPILIIIKELVS